ncbi:hypothetical protein IFR05_014459 [Cadophora sp. M221]|nr:hypothetical protein IFR05_014459 [Cadophora sp. M221]
MASTPATPKQTRASRPAATPGGSTKKPAQPRPTASQPASSAANRNSAPLSVFDIPPEYRKLLDVFDAVRRLDRATELDLPTLVVSGETSAGKSSVLEAITTLNFPRHTGRCTRYATIVSMRQEDTVTIKLYTTGSPSGVEFERTLEGEEALADLHDIIAIDVADHFGLDTTENAGTFSNGVLNIDYFGPKNPMLTVIDTPGFVASENYPEQAEQIKRIVYRYIKEKKNTIVLSIISAVSATDNQGILGIMDGLDETHERTMGIITKPDLALNNKSVLQLAENKHERWKMSHPWHVLKNADTTNGDVDLQVRNTLETEFFDDESKGWKYFPWEQKGIRSLVIRLQQLLYERTKLATQPVLTHIRMGLKELRSSVDDLEAYFKGTAARRKEFIIACRNLADLAKFGINGSYKSPYFRLGTDERRKLRHAVRRANYVFVDRIRGIHGRPNTHEEQTDRSSHDSGIGTPETQQSDIETTRNSSMPAIPEWNSENLENLDDRWKTNIMKHLLDNSQGEELTGEVDPQRMNLLFWTISERWQDAAREHVNKMYKLSQEFLNLIIDDWELASEGKYKFVKPEPDIIFKFKDLLESSFEGRLRDAMEDLQNIEGDRSRAAQTTDPTLAEEAQKYKWNRWHHLLNTFQNGKEITAKDSAEHLGIASLAGERSRRGEDYLDKTLLYYHIFKRALTKYQDNVIDQVVERHILHGLEKILRDVDEDAEEGAIDRILTSDNEDQKKQDLKEKKARRDEFEKCEKDLVTARSSSL